MNGKLRGFIALAQGRIYMEVTMPKEMWRIRSNPPEALNVHIVHKLIECLAPYDFSMGAEIVIHLEPFEIEK
jgi:hypothetical protein